MAKNEKDNIINFDNEKNSLVSYATSKGNLPKWHIGDYWYKCDEFGYESLAECLISDLLKYSNIYKYVKYDIVKGIHNGETKNFSVSKTFLREKDNLLTFYRLYFLEKGHELTKDIANINDVRYRIQYVVDFILNTYKINNASNIITSVLELDMFFLNEDRHFNNLALIRNNDNKKLDFAPVFDNGLSLLSDMRTYDLHTDIYKCIEKVKAKPFSQSLEEQCEKAETLYGTVLKLGFTKNDVRKEIEKYKNFYSDEIIDRVLSIIFEQMRKYDYLL